MKLLKMILLLIIRSISSRSLWYLTVRVSSHRIIWVICKLITCRISVSKIWVIRATMMMGRVVPNRLEVKDLIDLWMLHLWSRLIFKRLIMITSRKIKVRIKMEFIRKIFWFLIILRLRVWDQQHKIRVGRGSIIMALIRKEFYNKKTRKLINKSIKNISFKRKDKLCAN